MVEELKDGEIKQIIEKTLKAVRDNKADSASFSISIIGDDIEQLAKDWPSLSFTVIITRRKP